MRLPGHFQMEHIARLIALMWLNNPPLLDQRIFQAALEYSGIAGTYFPHKCSVKIILPQGRKHFMRDFLREYGAKLGRRDRGQQDRHSGLSMVWQGDFWTISRSRRKRNASRHRFDQAAASILK
jgi:hypothetical protein